MSATTETIVAAVVSSGVLVALIDWVRRHRGDQASAADVITQAAKEAVELARADNRELRDHVQRMQAEMNELRDQLVHVVAENHTLERRVGALQREVTELRASFAAERDVLLDELAKWDPTSAQNLRDRGASS